MDAKGHICQCVSKINYTTLGIQFSLKQIVECIAETKNYKEERVRVREKGGGRKPSVVINQSDNKHSF